MFDKPIFNQLSPKLADITLVVLATIVYIGLCAEADMYVPAFPQMITFFGVEESRISLILSINFAGLSISGLVVGPLSDSYGRRRILLAGLALFMISSLGCVATNNFNWMLFWRLIQGIAASIPMVVSGAAFFDKYPPEKAGQLLGVLNGIISAAMAGAPIAGAWISEIFDWRANFIVILGLAVVSFFGSLLFLEETLPQSKRRILNLTGVLKDYLKLSKSMKFLTYSLISCAPLSIIIVYIANLSVILVNHIGVDLVTCSYYQATTMGVFIVFSLFSARLIGTHGADYTKNLGGILAIIGSIMLFAISQLDPKNVNIIALAMGFISAGGALMIATFGLKALSIFPEMTGTAMAMNTAIRQLSAMGLVMISEIIFDGTIIPIAMIVCGFVAFCGMCNVIVWWSERGHIDALRNL